MEEITQTNYKQESNPENAPQETPRVTIQPKPLQKLNDEEIYFWDDCYPAGEGLNLGKGSDTLYAPSYRDCRVYKIDKKNKKLSFGGRYPINFPEQFQSFANQINTFNSGPKKIKIIFERTAKGSPVAKAYKYSYRNIEEQGHAQAEYLGPIDMKDETNELEFIWIFEVFENMISSKFSFLYSIMKEHDLGALKKFYYIGSIFKSETNCLRGYYSLNMNFSAKNKQVAEAIKNDSEGIDQSVKQVLKFSSNRKIHPDDFPADPDPRYSTFTFVEDKALICTIFDFRNKKIIKKSVITVYEIFKVLGFSSIYHSNGFSITNCTYSYKQDRVFLGFDNLFEYLSEQNPEHRRMFQESLQDKNRPHVYMMTDQSFALPRSFNVIIEGIRNKEKRSLRLLNNSQETSLLLPGKDKICIYNTIDFENKFELTIFDERTREERKLVMEKGQSMNSYLFDIFRVDDDHYVISDLTHFYLINFNTGEVLSRIQFKGNLDNKNNSQDGDILVNLNQYCTTLGLYKLNPEKTKFGLLYEISIKKTIRQKNLYGIDCILGLKKINEAEVLVLMKAMSLPRKDRRECEEVIIEFKLPLNLRGTNQASFRVIKPQIQRTPRMEAQFTRGGSWVVGVLFNDAILLSERGALTRNHEENLESLESLERQRSALLMPTTPDDNFNFLDYYFYEELKKEGPGSQSTAYTFIFQKKRGEITGEGPQFVEGDMPGAVPLIVLGKYEIENFVPGPTTRNFRLMNSAGFHKDAKYRVDKKLETPLFFVYEKFEEDENTVNRLRVFDEDLKELSRFDFSGFLLDVESQFNFWVLDENEFLVRLKKDDGDPDLVEGDGEKTEVIETVLFNLRTKKRRVLKNPGTGSGKERPDVSSIPMMFTGEGLVCNPHRGFKNENRESNDLYYYDLRPRSRSWIGSLYSQSPLYPSQSGSLLEESK